MKTGTPRAVARIGLTSSQSRSPRRNLTILRHAIDSAARHQLREFGRKTLVP